MPTAMLNLSKATTGIRAIHSCDVIGTAKSQIMLPTAWATNVLLNAEKKTLRFLKVNKIIGTNQKNEYTNALPVE